MGNRTLLCALAASLAGTPCAQEAPRALSSVDLEPLRAHFAGLQKNGIQWAAAWVVDREPVVLTHGTDAGGEALAASTLLPLGSMCRFLVADAVSAAGPAKVLDEVAVTVAGHELTVGELLRGTTLVPDWFATEPTSATFARSDVLACVEFAVQSGFHFDADPRGVGELALLADRLFSEPGAANWPAAVRTRLAPAAVGVDPVDLAAAEAHARVALTKAAGEQLAGAAAAPLRLCLSSGDVVRWWRWRAQREAAAEGARCGWNTIVIGYEGERMWRWSSSHGAFQWSIKTFAGGNAVLLQYAADAPAVDLTPEFLRLLFGPPVDEMGLGGRAQWPEPSLEAIAGTWLEPDGAGRLQVARGLFGWGLSLQVGDRRYTLESSRRTGDRYVLGLRRAGDTVDDQLLVWREGERQLRCVLLEEQEFSVIPRRLDFARAPAANTPR